MGLFSYTAPGASRHARRTAKYSVPDFSPGVSNIGRFTPRQFPESVSADQFFDIPKAIEFGAKVPIRSYEAPLAAIGATKEGQDFLDLIANGVRSIPFLGEQLSNAGDLGGQVLNSAINVVPAVFNSRDARFISETASMRDSASLPLQYRLISPDVGLETVGEYRQLLRQRGWTQQDFNDIVNGKKGWLDFGERKFISDPTLDFIGRVALDPTNLILAGGVIAKGARGAAELLGLRNAGYTAAKVFAGQKRLNAVEGVAALVNGTWQGVTKHSLALFVNGWVRGSGPVFNGWRNLGIGVYGTTVGMNAVSQIIPQDWAGTPYLEGVLDYFKRVDENKPLSDNMLFTLWGVMNFPLRSMLKDTYTKSKDAVVRRMYLDHDVKLFDAMGMKKADVLKAVGGQDSWDGWKYQLLRLALARKAFREGVGTNKALEWFYGSSSMELGLHFSGLNARMDRLIADALKHGDLTGRDMVDALHVSYANRGDILRSVTGGVERQTFDPNGAIREWNKFSALARHLSETYHDTNVIVPGISDQVAVTSQIDWIRAMMHDAGKRGRVTAKDANDILMNAPALFRLDKSGVFARTQTRSAESVSLKELDKALSKARTRAWLPSEWLAPAIEYERGDIRTLSRVDRAKAVYDQTGKLSRNVNPGYGSTRIQMPTEDFTKRQRTAPVDTVEQLRTLDARPGATLVRYNFPQAMAESGYDLVSVGSTGFIGEAGYARGSLATGMEIRVQDGVDLQTLAEIGTLGAGETSAKRFTIIIEGSKALADRGYEPNAMMFRWEAGKMTAKELDDAIGVLRTEFGDRVKFDASHGTFEVIVRDTDKVYSKDLDKRLERVSKQLNADSEKQPALVQDVVKGKGKYKDGTRTFGSVERIAAPRSHNWHVAKDRLEARRGVVPADARTAAERGLAGGGRAGETPADVLDKGLAPDALPRERPATLWERDHGREPGAVTDEYSLYSGEPGEYQGRVRKHTVGDSHGTTPNIPNTATRFISKSKHAGAWVDPSGRAHFWGNPGHDFGAVVADASNSATWTVIPDIAGSAGRDLIDRLGGEHGWRVVARDTDDVVYLVRDPQGMTGALEIPPKGVNGGGWVSVRDSTPVWTEENALNTVHAMRKRWLGEFAPDIRKGQIGGAFRPESSAVSEYAAKTSGRTAPLAEEKVPYNPPEVTPDLALNEAAQRKLEKLSAIETDMKAMESKLRYPFKSKKYRTLTAERDAIASGERDAEFGVGEPVVDHPGRANVTINDALSMNDESALTWLWDRDEELRMFKPNFDPSTSDMLDPAELQKLYAEETRLKLNDPQYTMKLGPQNATPYYSGQGAAYRAMIAGRNMAVDDWKYHVQSGLSTVHDFMFGRVYSRDLSNATRQEVYNQYLNIGASPGEVDAYMRALQSMWEQTRGKKLGVSRYRSISMLPSRWMDSIALGELKVEGFTGFNKKVIKALKANGDQPHDILRRAGSRTFRDLNKRFPAQDGRGNLGRIIEGMYGKQRSGPQGLYNLARETTYFAKVGYTVLRFLADPRWYIMNWFEADILGLSRAGIKATVFRGARKVDPATGRPLTESNAMRLHQNRFKSEFTPVEDILQSDTQASGWMDQRKLAGYVGAEFDVERPQTTMAVIRRMLEQNDPVIGELRRKFGGTPDDWVNGLEDTLYAVDTKGARRAVMDEAAAMARRKELVWSSGVEPKAWQDFLDGLYKAHQKNFQDIMHIFHGNVNRSNLERLLNSPLLWWPLSYQLKAGKWVIDILTDKMLGAQTDLLGAWGLNNLLAHHEEAYRNDPEYAAFWDDHAAAWRALAMMFPMTPFDMGVYMARWTRYAGSWAGEQLGLWDPDERYPHDPVNFIQRAISLGPYYSVGLLGDIFREFR